MLMSLIYFLIIGLCAGYVASRLFGLDSSDISKNLIIGIVGSFLGGLIGRLLQLQATGLIGSVIMSIIGACAAIMLYRFFSRKN